ncbi:MAG: DUF3144 domain-containing protein [Hyphomicrobiaceae bacterium]
MTDRPNRKERRRARTEGHLDTAAFIKTADKFIDLANRENRRTNATALHMAFLYASARYTAFVAKTMLNVPHHEKFVAEMAEQYKEMLRRHLADDGLMPGRKE